LNAFEAENHKSCAPKKIFFWNEKKKAPKKNGKKEKSGVGNFVYYDYHGKKSIILMVLNGVKMVQGRKKSRSHVSKLLIMAFNGFQHCSNTIQLY